MPPSGVSRLLERRACGRARVTYVTVTLFRVLFSLHACVSYFYYISLPPPHYLSVSLFPRGSKYAHLPLPSRADCHLHHLSPVSSVRCSRTLRSLTPRPPRVFRVYVHTLLIYICPHRCAHVRACTCAYNACTVTDRRRAAISARHTTVVCRCFYGK